MPDPYILSLDLETYGACHTNHRGDPLPVQTQFHPRRSLHTDKVSLADLVLTCAITYPKEDPRCSFDTDDGVPTTHPLSVAPLRRTVLSPPSLPSTTAPPSRRTPLGTSIGWRAPAPRSLPPWTGDLLSSLTPRESMVFLMHDPYHRAMLRAHLLRCDTIVGMNLGFDISYLRQLGDFRSLLTQRLTLIDVGVLNFIQSDLRPEKSLKDIGPILGEYLYSGENSLKDGFRYDSPLDPRLHSYNAQDTFNSLLACASLAKHTALDFPDSPKLSPFSLRYWSNQLWQAIAMMESGTPVNRKKLAALEASCLQRAEAALTTCASHDLVLAGKGSPASKVSFLTRTLDWIDTCPPPAPSSSSEPSSPTSSSPGAPASLVESVLGVSSVYDHPLCVRTKVKQELSTTGGVRQLALALLPPDHPSRVPLAAWQEHTTAQGLVSKYTSPLLTRRRSKQSKSPFNCLLIPSGGLARDVQLTYSKWFITPSQFANTDQEGGQRQARPSAQDPQVQQFPPPLKLTLQSRFDGGSLMSPDLSQIELRSAGLISGDTSLLLNYAEGRNLHRDRAIFVFGPAVVDNPFFKTGDGLNDPYQWAKTLNFEDLYMAGAMKMQQKMLEDSGRIFPLDFFREIVSSRATLRPGLIEWQLRTIAEAERVGHLILPITGHSRYFTGIGHKPNEMVNFPVQSVAAITMNCIQHTLARFLPGLGHPTSPCLLCINWYDALIYDVHPSFRATFEAAYADAVLHVATHGYWSMLQDHYGHSVPLKYEMKALNEE